MIIRHLLTGLLVNFRLTHRCQSTLHNELSGQPMGPRIDDNVVIVRYMYDGHILAQGRLCQFVLPDDIVDKKVTGLDILKTLAEDGVDFKKFIACVYEMEVSGGGWLPILKDIDDPFSSALSREVGDSIDIPINPTSKRRIDVKLIRRDHDSVDAYQLLATNQKAGKISKKKGYHAIGVVGIKRQANVGTLWRSAYQLGSRFIFTVGTRYKHQSTDTVDATSRLPFFELDDWGDFVKFAPKGARWIAIEMGGIPLDEFDHPADAIYLLGAEDVGLSKSIVRACHHVVSIDSERYASYNVAMAGTLVLYDRMVKAKKREASSL